MMTYVIGVTLMVLWFGAIIFLATYAMDGSTPAGIGAVIVFILGLSFVLYAIGQEENTGPCLKEETQWAFNAATKTTMPYTVCVERGEWVNP